MEQRQREQRRGKAPPDVVTLVSQRMSGAEGGGVPIGDSGRVLRNACERDYITGLLSSSPWTPCNLAPSSHQGFMVRCRNHAWIPLKWKYFLFQCLMSGNRTKSFSFSHFFFFFIDHQNQMRFCPLLPIHYYYLCNIATRIILMAMDPLWRMLLGKECY